MPKHRNQATSVGCRTRCHPEPKPDRQVPQVGFLAVVDAALAGDAEARARAVRMAKRETDA